jgi:hypothetical protein
MHVDMRSKSKSKKHSFFYRNSLTIVFMLIFIFSIAGQAVSGWKHHNEFLKDKGQTELPFGNYLVSPHFIQATFENWESEFLQMALFVILTIWLREKGSSESKPLEGDDDVDKKTRAKANSPWPVKKGGIILKIYENSLSIALLLLFIMSFGMHWYGSLKEYNLEQMLEHKPVANAIEYLGMPTFWFESFQNWQSEFLSVAAIVFLSVYLRQKGSPQSKPVNAGYDEDE